MIIDQNHPLAIHCVKRPNSLRRAPIVVRELAKTVDYWGAKCKEVEAGCPTCAAWKLFDSTLTCPTDEQVSKAVTEAR